MRNNYNECENEILQLYIDKELFHQGNDLDTLLSACLDGVDAREQYQHLMGIELIVRPECNQKCEYCYIARYGDELYPREERVSNEKILRNIDLLLKYIYQDRHAYINHYELFAGDLFYDNLYFDILDIFWKYLKPLHDDYPLVFEKYKGLILMPSNFSFIDDDEKAQRVRDNIAKFRAINWDLGFSISTDGKVMIDTREKRTLPEDHFDKLFQWTLEYPKNGFHAIISASNVKKMPESYDWWKEMYHKYYFEKEDLSTEDRKFYTHDFLPYWLEARNDDWTEEAIQDYLKFVDYAFEDRFKDHDYDIDKMTYHLFGEERDYPSKDILPRMAQNDPIRLDINVDRRNAEEIGCTISNLMCISVNNFALVPCHRLNYPQFRGGYFVLDDSEENIVGTRPFNVVGLISAKMCHSDSRPKCVNCIYNKVCHKGCLGAQFEASGELYQPALTVCRLFKAWYNHLVLLYKEKGILDRAFELNLLTPEQGEIVNTIYREILIQQDIKEEARRNGLCT